MRAGRRPAQQSPAGARRDADKVSVRAAGVLRNVAELELLQAPGLPFSVPRDLNCMPALTGAPNALLGLPASPAVSAWCAVCKCRRTANITGQA